MANLPHSIREETMTVMGVSLRCHILSDGTRIIDAGDVGRLFDAMGSLDGDTIDAITAAAFAPSPEEN